MNVQPFGLDPAFQYIRITRSGGITGATEHVNIDRTMVASVQHWGGHVEQVPIDAALAEDVLHALAASPADEPSDASQPRPDMYIYEVELSWNGTVRHMRCSGLGGDEALHGAIDLAETALQHHITMRSSPVGHDGVVAPNGNGGIVPPWLLDEIVATKA